MKRVVVFGAGSIGRGFVGASFGAAGWGVTFVDVVESLVDRLNADGAYHQVVVSNEGETTIRVAPVDAVLLSDTDAVVASLVGADFGATAVGAANLPLVASLISKGVSARLEANRGPLDVLLCENLHDAPQVVRELISADSTTEVAKRVGLLATSIGRMVPVPVPDPADPTRVRVEPYSFLPFDASALLGAEPDVPDLVPIRDGFTLYGDRKLYVHNMGHCMLAYLGELRGYRYLWQAAEDLELRYLARNAMVETAVALSVVHTVPVAPLLLHVDDLLKRFSNRALGDTVDRVGRDPQRKMQPDDRLLGSHLLCQRAGVKPIHVSVAVALGARRLAAEDGLSRPLVEAHLLQHLFGGDEAEMAAVRLPLSPGATSVNVSALVTQIDDLFSPSRII